MDKFKTWFIMIFTTISAFLGVLAIPVYILVALNVIDYITGIIAAAFMGVQISSRTSFQGIAKKVCMWLLVVVGVITDWLLVYTVSAVGINVGIQYAVGSLVAVWLICNELLSVLENIGNMGIKGPKFLIKIIEKLKSEVEKKGETE